MGSASESDESFRSREQLALVLVAGVAGLGVLAWAGFKAPSTWASASVAVVALAWLLICGRCLRAGVLVSGDRIVITNVFRTHELTRAEIECFTLGRWYAFPYCCIASLRSGRRLPATGIQRPSPAVFQRLGRTEFMVDRLNEILRRGAAPQG
jgi:hypothetical protein